MRNSPKAYLAADSSKIQLEHSQKLFSNSTFESIHRGSYLENIAERPTEMITRRLKQQRHPLSGMRALLPEMNSDFASSPDFSTEDVRNPHKLNSRILETWINTTIADATSLNLPAEMVKKESKLPLMRFGIDRTTLLQAGLQTGEVDRLYRSLFVYSIGFYQLIQKILEHTKKKYTIITGIWKAYAILLEYCCQLDYEMIVKTLNLEKKEEIDQLEAEFQSQISKLESHEKEMTESIVYSKVQLQEVQKELMNEVSKREELEDELLRRGSGHEEEVAMRLQFESKLNQMYAKMRDLQTRIEITMENLNTMQNEVLIRNEKLQKERERNVQLSKERSEMEMEMKKTEEKYKQTENININLEKRLTECYLQIESLSITLSNLNTTHNENLNTLAQKKIENDELRFSVEIIKGKISKTQTVVLEYESEKVIHLARIFELERTLVEETTNNKFYQQEYVKIKESDTLNSTELQKFKKRCEENEFSLEAVEKQRDSLLIQLDSMTSIADGYKLSARDLQHKLEEMNKGRRIVEEQNESLKVKLEDKSKEFKEARIQISGLKEEQERYKNKEVEMENEINDLKIKLQSVQKQFETTKETLQEKVKNLHEILDSEKRIRENWIYRYEEEQKVHSSAIKELLTTQDRLNEANIKNNNLSGFLEENKYQREKLESFHKEDLEELLVLRFQNEDYLRKNRTLQLLIESIDKEYSIRDGEARKEFEQAKEVLQQEMNRFRMKIEETWVQALANLEKVYEIQQVNKKLNKTLQGVEEIIADLTAKLNAKTQECNGRGLLLEDSRGFILNQYEAILQLKIEAKNLEIELKKARKEFMDYRNQAPQDLRSAPNPFRILVKQIEDLKGKIDYIESIKIELTDVGMQWDEPLPETEDREIQTEHIEYSREMRSQNSHYSKESSRSSADPHFRQKSRNRDREKEKEREGEGGRGRKDSNRDDTYMDEGLHRDDERITPLNLKSIYGKEKQLEFLELPGKSPAKLPSIANSKRTWQPNSVVHTPTPIPALPSNDFKRALKQAISRRNND